MCFRPVKLQKTKCPECGFENPAGLLKCKECGADLPKTAK